MRAASAGRSAVVTLAGQWSKYLVQVLALVVFSRLLDAQDFGLVTMVTAIVGVAYVIGDFGLSLAAIQAPNLTDGQRNNLFWLNAAIGVVIGGVVAALAVPLAALYDDPRVAPIALAMSIVFLANGLSTQFRTELNRQHRFADIAGSDVASQLAGFAVGLVAAILGAGYWALVLMQIVAAVIALAVVAVRSGWVPGRIDRTAPMRSLLGFGINTFAAQLVNYVSTNIDSVLIGRVWGAGVLGFYNRAFQLARVPTVQIAAPLTRVVLPHLSSRLDDPDAYGRAVGKAQLALTYILLSVLSVFAATADPLVAVALGSGWSETVPLLRALCLAGAFQAMGYIYYWILLSHAKTRLLFLSELGARIIMVVLMIALVPLGAFWVALASAFGQLLITVSGAIFALPRVGIGARGILSRSLRPAVLFGIVGALDWWISLALPSGWPAVLSLVVLCAAWLAIAAAALMVPAIRRDLDELWGMRKGLARTGRA